MHATAGRPRACAPLCTAGPVAPGPTPPRPPRTAPRGFLLSWDTRDCVKRVKPRARAGTKEMKVLLLESKHVPSLSTIRLIRRSRLLTSMVQLAPVRSLLLAPSASGLRPQKSKRPPAGPPTSYSMHEMLAVGMTMSPMAVA